MFRNRILHRISSTASFIWCSKALGLSRSGVSCRPPSTCNVSFDFARAFSSQSVSYFLKRSDNNGRSMPSSSTAYRFNDGWWFYCVELSYDDSTQWMFLRRRGVRKKITFSFQLDPKIPFEEPTLCTKRNMFDSGDAVNSLEPIDLSKPLVDFINSEELKTANEDVKKLFSLAMGSRKDLVNYKIHEFEQKVQRHKFDKSSPEAYIAQKTARIRNFQEIFKANPLNKKVKHFIGILIDKRNKKLRILRMQDIKRFNWLIETLGITYHPTKLGMVEPNPWRAKVLTDLTEEYCEKMKKDKLEDYHRKLKEQQESFMREKEESLKWIEEQESKYGLSKEETKKSFS